MTIQSKILIGLAIAGLLIGAIIVVWTFTAWPRMAVIDGGILVMKYDPNTDPEDPQSRKYANLYHMTEVFLGERNRDATWFLCTLGLAFLAVGGILLAWSIDRERLSRRLRHREPQ